MREFPELYRTLEHFLELDWPGLERGCPPDMVKLNINIKVVEY